MKVSTVERGQCLWGVQDGKQWKSVGILKRSIDIVWGQISHWDLESIRDLVGSQPDIWALHEW